MPSLTFTEILLRLVAAVVVGAVLGIDRELRNKPAGLRTMALVALGSAMFTLIAVDRGGAAQPDAISRVVQGIITGIGFLGAGAILHRDADGYVSGLTTAASIWLAAALGISSGLAHWPLVLAGVGLGITLLVLTPLEDRLRRWFGA